MPEILTKEEIAALGEDIYKNLYQKDLREMFPGRFVAIDLEKYDAMVGDTEQQAWHQAFHNNPMGRFHIRQIEYPVFRPGLNRNPWPILNHRKDWHVLLLFVGWGAVFTAADYARNYLVFDISAGVAILMTLILFLLKRPDGALWMIVLPIFLTTRTQGDCFRVLAMGALAYALGFWHGDLAAKTPRSP